MTKERIDVYQIVTDRILELLAKGVVPWSKPWKSGSSSMPRNLTSGKAYRGVNILLLWSQGYENPYWLTFNQCRAMGGTVRKGEKGTMVVFWKMLKKEDKETKEEELIPLLRFYYVFNATQCDDIKTPFIKTVPDGTFSPMEACESIVSSMTPKPLIRHGGSLACYSPASDTVTMPDATAFKTASHYYCTLFHELTHATGHKSRIGRKLEGGMMSESYSKEELIAEMGASFLCAFGGVDPSIMEHNAAYIAGWMKRLGEDKKLIVCASAAAQKASDYILGTTFTAASDTDES